MGTHGSKALELSGDFAAIVLADKPVSQPDTGIVAQLPVDSMDGAIFQANGKVCLRSFAGNGDGLVDG